MKEKETGIPIIVCTEYRGVFFGYVDKFPESIPQEIKLYRSKMCVYWSEKVKGIMGLAENKNLSGCKITGEIPSILLNRITAIMEVSSEAEKAWQKGNWE